MKKYIDISNEIKDQFKTGIQILDDVSNDIQEFLTLLQSSSGETIELIKSDLTFLKDKYTTIKEKVEKRSSEIEERANNYDACLEPYIEKMNNGTLIDKSVDYLRANIIEKKIVEVQGPEESEDGLGYYKVRTSNVDYILGKKLFEDPRRVRYDVYKIDGMLDFIGGLWNASDYSSKDAYYKPTPSRDAVEELKDIYINHPECDYWTRRDFEQYFISQGYTSQEALKAVDSGVVDWQKNSSLHAQDLYGSYNKEQISNIMEHEYYTKEEIEYALSQLK